MSKGLVYILTNPCLDGWVKIGMTENNDIEKRLKDLNSPSNIPLSFRCYATYEVENPKMVEDNIHSIIDEIDNSLHAREKLKNGKIREREFFRISAETAFKLFKHIATLRDDLNNLKVYEPTLEEINEEKIVENKNQRFNTTFKILNINIGDEISFLYDENIKAKVLDDKNKIEFENETYSVTGLAKKLVVEKRGWKENPYLNGWKFFTKDGIVLTDLRTNDEEDLD